MFQPHKYACNYIDYKCSRKYFPNVPHNSIHKVLRIHVNKGTKNDCNKLLLINHFFQLNSLEPMKVVSDIPYSSNTIWGVIFELQNLPLISTSLILLLRVIFNYTVLKNNLRVHFY